MLFSVTGIRILTASETIHFLILRPVVDRKGGRVGGRVAWAGGMRKREGLGDEKQGKCGGNSALIVPVA